MMQIIDYDMPYEQFLAIFAGINAEWIDGVVYQLPRCSEVHKRIQETLHTLFSYYFKQHPVGQIVTAPTRLHVSKVAPARCPDLQVLVGDNTDLQHGHEVTGSSDIVIEIISELHHTLERGDKFIEYEQAGVGEYWIVDPIREDCLFYTLENHVFRRRNADENGIYHSTRLKGFSLPIQFLWTNPSDDMIRQLVEQM